ncbi:hypothetical protein [Mycetocola spongiae]|uniref:hypothetical protein n=1 Tax=Mycetocola spongiae TaxID=2859226 RepID=UPI001CF54B83|nr:hypothetical protein [Mycetocola spongiae]UCR89877.1 hypothetical protein KXZ72_04195 [Mycetocola spongiae]
MTVLNLILAGLPAVFSALFLLRAWRQGRFSLRDRVGALAELLGVAAVFAAGALLVDWSRAPVLLWILAVAFLATAVLALVLRWANLPWLRARRRTVPRLIRLGLGAVAALGLIGFAAL